MSFKLFFKSLQGKTIPVDIREGDKTENVISKLAPQMGEKADNISIIYSGKELENGVDVYNMKALKNVATLHVIPKNKRNSTLNNGVDTSNNVAPEITTQEESKIYQQTLGKHQGEGTTYPVGR